MMRGARFEAMQNGQRRYLAERPCKRGHLGERMTSTGTCIECRQIKAKERYHADPQKAVAKVLDYYQKNAELVKEKRRQRYAKNPEKELADSRIRVAEWRAANPDKVKAQKPLKKAYKQANPEKMTALLAKRRAAKLQRTPKWLSVDDLWLIEQAYEVAALRSKATNIAWHVDHIFPLQGELVSGLHVPTNLQVIPWFDNLSKANKFEVAP
jgi:hypothetical protein